MVMGFSGDGKAADAANQAEKRDLTVVLRD
jgi:hypothetical protein